MLCPDGSVKVLDFGLAMLREADSTQFTRIGQILGTPAYMAPEQIQSGLSGPRSDLYALGCVIHEMLTGEQLFTGPTEYVVFERQVKERPPAVPGVPAELNRLIEDLLEKDPDNRPVGADVLYERLQPFAVDLPMLPGFLHPSSVPSPGRMYARMVGRVLA
jgi:non-specific serine/threonine protein kinase